MSPKANDFFYKVDSKYKAVLPKQKSQNQFFSQRQRESKMQFQSYRKNSHQTP